MLRFILVAIFLLLYFLFGIPVLGILWLIGKVNKRSADLAALRIVQWGFKVILKISGVEVTVIGEDRVLMNRFSTWATTEVILTFC